MWLLAINFANFSDGCILIRFGVAGIGITLYDLLRVVVFCSIGKATLEKSNLKAVRDHPIRTATTPKPTRLSLSHPIIDLSKRKRDAKNLEHRKGK